MLPNKNDYNQLNKKQIAILGSTGSIGRQTLDIIQKNSDFFQAHTITAGTNASLLIEQAIKFRPNVVVIADENQYEKVKDALENHPINVYTGAKALDDVVQNAEIDIVVSALVGFAGLSPTIQAIKSKKAIALANKETLVVAGEIITQLAAKNNVPILPVDSEHSAIFQSLSGEFHNRIEKIILTASGGPFRNISQDGLSHVTAKEALQHPNWTMGDKITIDSATMMNKGFEMIEAKWLFSVEPQNIEIVVHPESILHSAVQFEDGAIIGQLGLPDMHIPIQYALSYPYRLPIKGDRVNLFDLHTLHFEKPDFNKFPSLLFCYQAISKGGNIPCALNAANEITNLAFRKGDIRFNDIAPTIEKTIDQISYIKNPQLDDILATNREARQIANNLL